MPRFNVNNVIGAFFAVTYFLVFAFTIIFNYTKYQVVENTVIAQAVDAFQNIFTLKTN